jgi:putative transposase
VRDQFLVEVAGADKPAVTTLAELNTLFTAWVEQVCHTRPHSETGQPPLARRDAGGPFAVPSQDQVAEAFRWSEWRTASKTAVVSLHGNRYQVDPALAGRRVELVFDPFSMTTLDVRCDGKAAGTASPWQITRHSHPKARPEDAGPADAPRATGIDYLNLIATSHDQAVAGPVNYEALAGGQPPPPPGTGQPSLPGMEQDGQPGQQENTHSQEDNS